MNHRIIDFVSSQPCQSLLDGPTPLIHLQTLSNRLKIELWMKHDDLAGPSSGENKVRPLEYYFGEACVQKTDTILITEVSLRGRLSQILRG